MCLCEDCTCLNLSTLFEAVRSSDIVQSQERVKTSNENHIQQLSLFSLRQSSKICDLCALLLKLVIFQDALLPKWDPTEALCKIFVIDYGDILSDKSGAMIPLENFMGYASKVVESIPRLSIHVEFGTQRRIILPCGLQVKASDSPVVDKSTFLRGRLVGPQAGLQLMLKWIRMCSETHGTTCVPSHISDEIDALTMRVIYIERLYIVGLPEDSNYVVLSYVWGETEQLRLLQENYGELTQAFGLRSLIDRLPRTIADAMGLVGRLSKRFLWVDSLCIIQDDPADLAVQIQQMNVIYGCAALTIVAAAGSNSNAGLPSLNPNSRKSFIIDEEIQGVRLITSLPDFAQSINNSTWESRGWTMQEKILSKRLLIFTEYQVFYHCNSATWCEDAIWESEDPYIQLQSRLGTLSPHLVRCALPHRSFTGVRKYSHLVTSYHDRQLSYESDALNAFTGVLTALGKELKTSFIWGLPESAFDDTLLWRSPIQMANLRREQFPSWTWLGWKASGLPGDIEFPVVHTAHVETVFLVQWHQITAKGEQKLIGPSTTYYELPKFESLPSPKVP
jgi:hypothetical protein